MQVGDVLRLKAPAGHFFIDPDPNVPLVLIGGWMVKNQALYGRPTLSSWVGMNLQRAVIPVLDADDLQQMYDEGKVSDVAMVGPFGAYDLYAPYFPDCTPSHHQ